MCGTLELDRLIMQPGGAIPLANVNLVLGAVTCADKLSLVVREPWKESKIKQWSPYLANRKGGGWVKRVNDGAKQVIS
jgi:hypothetical protein